MDDNKKKTIFDNKRIVLLFAFVLAILSWIVVAGFINPGQTRVISNIKIDYTKKEADYQNKNLQIVSDLSDLAYADLQISGDGSLLSSITNADVIVYPDFSAVNGAGEHVVPLKAEKIKQGNYSMMDISLKNSEHSLKNNASSTITLTFEEVETKTLPITVKADGITASEGYFKDTATTTPAEVTISGPKSEVSAVAKVVAIIPEEQERNEPIIFTGIELELLNENDLKVDGENIVISPTDTVEVNIPILEVRSVDLTIDFTGVPQYFDLDWLKTRMHLSTDNVQIIGTSEAFENLSDPYPVYTVELSQLEPGWVSDPFKIELPEGLEVLEQNKQLVITYDSTGLVEKSFGVSNIRLTNVPRNATITPIITTVRNVVLIGPEDQINTLLSENIEIEVDAFDVIASKDGQQTIPARVLIPGANRVFAMGHYPVVCNVVIDKDTN